MSVQGDKYSQGPGLIVGNRNATVALNSELSEQPVFREQPGYISAIDTRIMPDDLFTGGATQIVFQRIHRVTESMSTQNRDSALIRVEASNKDVVHPRCLREIARNRFKKRLSR